jgi:EAL domain-containing protein (putative c-di-GMP-specific phosphodiesterase class I)
MEETDIQQCYLRNLISDLTGWNEPVQKLTRAFAQNEFVLYSQTIRALAGDADPEAHIEVFVRLQEEERNLIPPGTFLPLLEHYNFGPKLDRYVLRRVLVWKRGGKGRAASILHVNLCVGTLADQEFPDFVGAELKTTGLTGDRLCFEIPDIGAAYEPEGVDVVRRLKSAGCLIALRLLEKDQISFQPMKDLGADVVKIGGSLTRDIVRDKAAAAKLRALARACRAFNIRTVAQNIEDTATLDMLKTVGVDFAQGYGIAKPEPLESLP